MPSTIKLFEDNLSNTLIETGSLIGKGIQDALKAGFNKVISIELSDKYYKICKKKFKDNKSVTIIKGASELKLKEAIDLAEGRITFWLDGHFSGGDTAKGENEVPIIQELTQIKEYGRKDDIILIDDLKQIRKAGISEEKLEEILTTINPNYILTKVQERILIVKP